MKNRLAAIFFYADGCSLWLDDMLGDPPPGRIMLRTGSQDLSYRFRLTAVDEAAGEAWYAEVGPLQSAEWAGL